MGDELAALRQRVADLEQQAEMREAQLAQARAQQDAYRVMADELRALIDCSPYCIHRINASGELTSMNRAGLEMLGVAEESEVVGTPFLDAVGPADRARIGALYERAMAGESSRFEFTAANGRVFKSCFIPFVTEGGASHQLMGLTQDVTDLRSTIDSLERSEELNRRILEVMPTGMAHVGADGTVLSANQQAIETLGLAKGDLEGSTTPDFEPKTIFEDGSPCTVEDYPVTKALVTGERQAPVTIGTRRPDGSIGWAVYTAIPVHDPAGEVASAVVTFADITDRKQHEAERQRFEAKMLQAQKLESLGALTGGIAHDFNNLLVGVLGNAGLARAEVPSNSTLVPLIEQIEAAARRGSELVQQMMAYSGHVQLQQMEAIGLSEIAATITQLLRISIPTRVELVCELAEGLPPIRGDATQIRQIFMNLVTNAAESFANGSGQVTVTTSLIDVVSEPREPSYTGEAIGPGAYAALEVTDTGCGMDAGTLTKIFDPFFTTKVNGRGLGLSAVLGIVRRHHGGVYISSAPGAGTSFRILLPVANGGALDGAERTRRADKAPRAPGTALIVDDDGTVQAVACAIVKRLGFRVVTADDGVQAVARFREHADTIQVVLLDLVMPRMDGSQAFRLIREIDPDVPIILTSGHSPRHVATTFDDGSPVDFLQKPYGPPELARMIESVLAR